MRRNPGVRTYKAIPSYQRYLIFFLLLFLGMTLYVWEQVKVGELAKEINRLKAERERLWNENEHLRVEIAALSSRERIERIAQERLEMVYPSKRPLVLFTRVSQNIHPSAKQPKISLKAQIGYP